MSLEERVKRLIDTVKSERAIAPGARTSGADDTQLDMALELLVGLQSRLAHGEPPSGSFAYPNLSRMVTESWNLTSPLARDLVEVEHLYLKSKH